MCIGWDPAGVVLATGSTDGNIYLLSGAPSRGFEVLGYTSGVPGAVRHLGLGKAPGLTSDTDKMRVRKEREREREN